MQLQLVAGADPPVPSSVDLRHSGIQAVLDSLAPASAGLVHADPPWTYNAGTTGNGAAAQHYECITMADIAAHVESAYATAAPDCYLVLWCTWPMLDDWQRQAATLSWEYLTGGAWAKVGGCGVGYHWRGNSEPVLIYRKGRPKPVNGVPGALRNSNISPRSGHSAKPIQWLAEMFRCWGRPGLPVLDLYAGLATAADAAIAAGLPYIGAEIDEERHARGLALVASGTRRAGVVI